MIELVKLAMEIIAEVIEVVQQADRAEISEEQARTRLDKLRSQLELNDATADKLVDEKFSPRA